MPKKPSSRQIGKQTLSFSQDELARLFAWGDAYQEEFTSNAAEAGEKGNSTKENLNMVLAAEQTELLSKVADAAGIRA